MKRHNVTLTNPVSEIIQSEVAAGRFKDFSEALQAAAWNYFCQQQNIFAEYEVTAEQVEKAYQKSRSETARLKKAGKLKEWNP